MKRKKSTRILALAGIVLLLAMYASTMVFALMDSPAARGLFAASIFCTFAVPLLLYGMMFTADVLRGRGAPKENEAPEDSGAPEDNRTTEESGATEDSGEIQPPEQDEEPAEQGTESRD